MEDVSIRPLDPFYPDSAGHYAGESPSYPGPQPPLVYGPVGLDPEPTPTPTYGPEVSPIPVEAVPTTPLDPTYYARELLDPESSPGPQPKTSMDYFDPMVEFLPPQYPSIRY